MNAPLVPDDVVIPVRFVPIYPRRLFGSTLWAVATPAEFRAAFALWINSWDQRPSGSLPSTDRELCRLAELGGDLAKWGKVKRIALRHWVECDDGRLYHPVVAEFVLEAWEAFNKRRAQTEAATAARQSRRSGQRNDQRNVGENGTLRSPKTRQDIPPPYPPRDRRGDLFSKIDEGGHAGNGLAAPPARNPKHLGHFDGCGCPNCTRWAEQQRAT